MFLINKITIVLLCSNILLACTTAPQSKKKTHVEQLTNGQFQQHFGVIDKPVTVQAVSEEANTLPVQQPLKEVNQVGQVPTVTTITDQTLEMNEAELAKKVPSFEWNFEEVGLLELVQMIADHLNISLVIDTSIPNTKISIRTAKNKPLTKKDLWPVLQLLLKDAGINIEKKGKVYHLKKSTTKLPGTIGIHPKTLIDSDASEVLQITPLRYITTQAAQTVINPLVHPEGRVINLPTLNIIGITTTPQKLERVNKLLHIIDADPFLHRGMRLFRLLNSKATKVQTELDKILKAIYGKTPSAYQLIALERLNAILIIAPPNSGFNEITMWVEILDERSEDSGDQVFIYKVKNLEAASLASTLSNVFKIDQKIIKEKQEQKKQQKQPSKKKGSSSSVSAELTVNIVADESTNSLLIRATPHDYRQLLNTIYGLDQVPKEVMINVVLAEVKLTEATQFGIDWQALFGKNQGFMGFNFNIPTGNFPVEVKPKELDSSSLSGLTGLTLNYLSGDLNAVLNLIASTNELSILSRPSLLVRNNEEALINIGSNEPFLSGINSSSVDNQILSNDVQYKDTGITVKVTPRINDDGIINLKIFQELSQLGELRTTQNLQSFIQRKIETSVVVRDGNAIVIGGLIQSIDRDNQQGIPLLKDIPIIGRTLFSSTDVERERTELVLIIVPQIVNPEDDNHPLLQNFKQRMQMVSQLLNEQYVLIDALVPVPRIKPKSTLPFNQQRRRRGALPLNNSQ